MPKRQKILEHKILRILKDCGEYMLPEESLHDQLRVSIRPPPTTAEINEAVQNLDSDLKILGVREDDEVKYKLTARGVAALVEAEQV